MRKGIDAVSYKGDLTMKTPILSFIQFISEENVATINKSKGDVYKNPSSSDLAKLQKKLNRYSHVRYLADSLDKSVYCWDAEKGIHRNVLEELIAKGIIKKTASPFKDTGTDYSRFLYGVANLRNGEMIHNSSDELDSLARNFKKNRSSWSPSAVQLFSFFKSNIDLLIERFEFVNRYIKQATSKFSSLGSIKTSLETVKE